jgi:DNA-binding NarL/FixJ family response regulator
MRILLADDHELVRDALIALLDQEADMSLTAANDLPDAMERLGDGFDLVLLDYDMPGMDGLNGLEKMKAATQVPVAILSGSANRDVAQDALDRGAAGFLPKTMESKTLAHAIRFMAAGEIYAPIKFLTTAPEDTLPEIAKQMTKRELQVLECLCRGLSNKEIAREVELQEVTVKLHVKTACRKLGAKNRTQAAIMAKEAGIF